MKVDFVETQTVGPIEGNLQIAIFKGAPPKLKKGEVTWNNNETRLVSVSSDRNQIMVPGREALAQMMAGAIPGKRLAYIELGVGAYGASNQASISVDPPAVVATDSDVIVPLSPRLLVPIDPVDGVVTPINNPLARTFTAIVDALPTGGFDSAQYIGISEYLLRFDSTDNGGVITLGPPIAKRHKKPVVGDPESSMVIRWTLQF